MKEFIKFKEECNKTGTTEEALANAEKLGFETGLFVKHPFIKTKNTSLFCKFRFNGLWDWSNIWLSRYDQSDFDFAKKYDLNILRVVSNEKDDL